MTDEDGPGDGWGRSEVAARKVSLVFGNGLSLARKVPIAFGEGLKVFRGRSEKRVETFPTDYALQWLQSHFGR